MHQWLFVKIYIILKLRQYIIGFKGLCTKITKKIWIRLIFFHKLLVSSHTKRDFSVFDTSQPSVTCFSRIYFPLRSVNFFDSAFCWEITCDRHLVFQQRRCYYEPNCIHLHSNGTETEILQIDPSLLQQNQNYLWVTRKKCVFVFFVLFFNNWWASIHWARNFCH